MFESRSKTLLPALKTLVHSKSHLKDEINLAIYSFIGMGGG
jgi:hypothetical protein